VRLHTAAGTAAAAEDTWQPSQTPSNTAASPAWQLLQLQGQDELSFQILACRNPAELLQLTDQIASTGSKLHAARFTVMAASVTSAEPGSSSSSSSAADAAGTAAAAPISSSRASDEFTLRQLLWQALQLLTHGSNVYPYPPLACLSSVYLKETLMALQQLVQQAAGSDEQQQQQQAVQQQLRPVVLQLAEQDMLSGIHACCEVQQLATVVHWLQEGFGAVHVKAAFVQLARLCGSSLRHDSSSSHSTSSSSSSSHLVARDLADRLLQLLFLQQQQQQQLQPHHAASIVWSLGQLQPLGLQQYNQQLGQQLLHVALGGLVRFNPRVTAMLLHGAARLQLQLPGSNHHQQQQQQQGSADVQQLLQCTQQQLSRCDPQALSCLLWSLSALQQQPGEAWLQQFYSSSWPMLRHRTQIRRSNSSSNSSDSQPVGQHENGSSRQQQQRQDQQTSSSSSSSSYNNGWRDSQSSFNAQELTAVLSALVQLEQQPPVAWLAAAAASCHRQMQHFGQQELAVMLWAFAGLQQQLPQQMLAAAVTRVQQLQGTFSPQSTALLLYALTRMQQQEQRHQQEMLMMQLWQQLQHSAADWPATLEAAQQQLQVSQGELLPEAAAAAAAATSASANASSSSSIEQLVEAICSHTRDQLQQHNAHDLALLAWSLGRHCWHHHQQLQHELQQLQRLLQLPDAAWLQSYMAAAAQQLQRGRMSSSAMSMTLWGLAAVLQASAQQLGSTSSSSSSSLSSSVDDLQLPAASSSSWSPAAAFWKALEQQSAQQLSSLSAHELANLLWGAGHFVCCTNVKPSSDWIDIVACHCLDLLDQLSSYQLVSALQGLAWLKHPRGLSLLQAALSEQSSSRLVAATPLELLQLLRGCVFYRHTPAAAARVALLTAARRNARCIPAHQVAQLLYMLGKMQQQHNKRQNLLMLRQLAAAAAAAAAGHSPVSSFEESSSGYQQQLLQQRQLLMQQCSKAAGTGNTPGRPHSSSSSGAAAAAESRWTSSQWQQQQQQQVVAAVQVERLVPAAALCDLVQQMRGRLHQCSHTQVMLMFWGVSQLAPGVGLHMQQQQQPVRSSGDGTGSSSSSTRSKPGSSKAPDNSSSSAASQQPLAAAVPFSDCPAGVHLLDELYSYSLQQLPAFSSSQLAALLYAVHKLGVVSPPAAWLAAVAGRLQLLLPELGGQAGQDLAAVAVALSGFNWVPSDSWLAAFVEAAAAAEQAGLFRTEWQQQCFSNGLSALDPVAGQMWLQRGKVSSSRTPVVAAAAAGAYSCGGGSVNAGAGAYQA
jgi:hypothetical protein